MTRPLDLDALVLAHGQHATPSEGMCLLEAVAYVAGEAFSDHPVCVSPGLAAFGRAWNDALGNEERQVLKRFVPRLVGTRSTLEVEERRAWLACDWLVRVHAPAWLELADLGGQAETLRSLGEISSAEDARAAQASIVSALVAARAAAGAAAWAAAGAAAEAAAGDAAGAAAWVAAGAAAGAAAWDAAGAAAGAAAWDAAGDAARAAAWDAARAAARAALQPTVLTLQASALDLFDRMIQAEAAAW